MSIACTESSRNIHDCFSDGRPQQFLGSGISDQQLTWFVVWILPAPTFLGTISVKVLVMFHHIVQFLSQKIRVVVTVSDGVLDMDAYGVNLIGYFLMPCLCMLSFRSFPHSVDFSLHRLRHMPRVVLVQSAL